MASAHLQITVNSASNLYNSDGILAGKSDPYVIVEVPGQADMKFKTPVLSNTLDPVWSFTGEIKGFMDGDLLQFTVMDSDTFPKPDQLLGKVALTADAFYPQGLNSELALTESKTQARLNVVIVVLGNIPAPEAMLVSGPQTLSVNIMKARNLYNADGILAGKSDPYCICMVPGKKKSQFRTPTLNNCLDPEWFYSGRIHDFVAGDSLEFQVWDSDTFPKPDQLLGKVTLSPQDFLEHPTGLAGTFRLTEGVGGDQGILELAVQCDGRAIAGDGTSTVEGTNILAAGGTGRVSTYGHVRRANVVAAAGTGRVKVTVQRAAGLYNADWVLAGKSDPYVVCVVQGKEDQKYKKFQTPVINNNLDPVWNHVGMLKGFVDGDVLELQVWDKDVWPKQGDFLGRLVLNSTDFFPHGLQGELLLVESKSQNASLSLRIEVFPDTATGIAAPGTLVHAPGQVISGGCMGAAAMDTPGQVNNRGGMGTAGMGIAGMGMAAMGMAAGGFMVHEMGRQMQEPVPTYGTPTPTMQPGMAPRMHEPPMMYGVDSDALSASQPMTYGAPSPLMTYHAATPPSTSASQPMTYGAPSPLMAYHAATPPSTTMMTYGAPPSADYTEDTTPLASPMVYSVTKHEPVSVSPEEFKKGHGALVHVTGFRHQGLEQPEQEIHDSPHTCPLCDRPPVNQAMEEMIMKREKLSHKKKSKSCC